MTYRHLTLEQRYQIAALRSAGASQKAVADKIGRHPSTIGRELSRNGCADSYAGSSAHRRAEQRRTAASSRSPLAPGVASELVTRLKEDHSPEQINGRLALLKAGKVSHTTVYRYARKLGLRLHLRHPKRRRGYGKRPPRRFADRKPIQGRPTEFATRSRIGDWEGDSVRPVRGTGAVITLVERRSGYVRLAWTPTPSRKPSSAAWIVWPTTSTPSPSIEAASLPKTAGWRSHSRLRSTSPIHTAHGNAVATRASTACCGSISRAAATSRPSQWKSYKPPRID